MSASCRRACGASLPRGTFPRQTPSSLYWEMLFLTGSTMPCSGQAASQPTGAGLHAGREKKNTLEVLLSPLSESGTSH